MVDKSQERMSILMLASSTRTMTRSNLMYNLKKKRMSLSRRQRLKSLEKIRKNGLVNRMKFWLLITNSIRRFLVKPWGSKPWPDWSQVRQLDSATRELHCSNWRKMIWIKPRRSLINCIRKRIKLRSTAKLPNHSRSYVKAYWLIWTSLELWCRLLRL